jgi:ubiquinone biosynthesis monooxygenase Coq7
MRDRSLTPLDRLLVGANNALRTVSAPAGRPARENPAEGMDEASLDDRQRSHAAGLMRVNHAGEIAAQGLYQGHAAVARDKSIEAQMQRAADEEFDLLLAQLEPITLFYNDIHCLHVVVLPGMVQSR